MSLIGLLTATETGLSRSTAYEAHSVAPQTKLEGSRINGKGDSSSQVAVPPSKMVAGENTMCSKVNHYTHYNMLCNCLQTHQKKLT